MPSGPGGGSSVESIEPGHWTLCSTEPSLWTDPTDIDPDRTWREAVVPGTVAQAVGPSDLDRHQDYDESDWWYRCRFERPETTEDGPYTFHLCFDGLATIAKVWLNGQLVITSNNMFVSHRIDITDRIAAENEVVIVFRSVAAGLRERRPRPRWKTRLVEHQQLRWMRTTLLGRIPGWTPRVKPVGPWRPVWLERSRALSIASIHVATSLGADAGKVEIDADLTRIDPGLVLSRATVSVGTDEAELATTGAEEGWNVSGTIRISNPELWWPQTHGAQNLYPVRLELTTSGGTIEVDCGRIGFRSVEVDRSEGRVQYLVNGAPVFCRGACWTTTDIVSLEGDPEEMRRTLGLLADANANMVRVGGTMVYESDAFYEACDELGLMVWQDFMFANMDYPVDDEDFRASVTCEASQQISRLARHASVVTFCGGSEIEQQAAMFGAAPESWTNSFFGESLPALVAQLAPGTPYWSSTPTGGVLPFHVGEGLAHYYGVGAYRRGLHDARLSAVKFSPECLGFSHVPENSNLRQLNEGSFAGPHDPRWKAGVPRDGGAGWDFEDIRDHYLRVLYGVDPVELRSVDLDRYSRLSRTVTGRVIATVFDEWQSPDHPAAGALLWFLRDLRPGAGWGLVDSDNQPKPAYFYLKRAWSPVRITLLDRGLDGLKIEMHNETDQEVSGTLQLVVYGKTSNVLSEASESVSLASRSVVIRSVEGLLDHFADPTYAYRFGPLRHAAVHARLVGEDVPGKSIERLYWSALDRCLEPAQLDALIDGESRLVTIQTSQLARDVRLVVSNRSPADNYFDMPPGGERRVTLSGGATTERAKGHVEAENAPDGVRLSS